MLTRLEWDVLYSEMENGDGGLGRSSGMACRELGIKVKDYNKLMRRSVERRVGDEEWVHEVREQVEGLEDMRGSCLEDEAYKRAMEGQVEDIYNGEGELKERKVKRDNRLLERLLGKYNPAFREKKGLEIDQQVTISLGGEDMRAKLLAMRGMRESDVKHKGNVVEGEVVEEGSMKGIEKVGGLSIELSGDKDEDDKF